MRNLIHRLADYTPRHPARETSPNLAAYLDEDERAWFRIPPKSDHVRYERGRTYS